MICEAGGQWAWLASGMNFKFIKPVYFDETVTCQITINTLDDRGAATAGAVFTNSKEEVVLTADLKGFVPVNESRSVLSEMIEEGDPTNPLR